MFQIYRDSKLLRQVCVLLARIEQLSSSSNDYTDDVFGTSIPKPRSTTIKLPTTRGIPSRSTNLKEALNEKIPLHHDLLRKFRQKHGPDVVAEITVNDIYRGLDGVDALVRETSEVDTKIGLKYRGLSIPEVFNLLPRRGNSPSPEALFWLLVTGDVPTYEQTESLTVDWIERRDKRKEWWSKSGEIGGIVGNVLRSLPSNVSPVSKLAIALTALDADQHFQNALKTGAMSYTYWEHVYEDSMELLASLPAIVALITKPDNVRRSGIKIEKEDWVEFFINCLRITSDEITETQCKDFADFLRLYITVNADDDGGVPGSHIAQIMGSSQFDVSRALAAGVLAYANEPRTGTLHQCMDFQDKVKKMIGREPKNETLRNFVVNLINNRYQVVGHKASEFEDTRYQMLANFVEERVPDNPEVKLSQKVTNIYTKTIKNTKGRAMVAEQNAIAAPLFQLYGLRDMNYNQSLLCMSRALGIVASMIWTAALNAPVERPRAKCTHTLYSALNDDVTKKKNLTKKFKKWT